MAIRLTETRLRQIIREEASRLNEMAKTVYDPMGNPAEIGNSIGRPRTKFDKIVRGVMSYYRPGDPTWAREVPRQMWDTVGGACGGPQMRNWDKVVDAFVSAGLSKEEANKVVGRGYSAIYSPWVEYDGLVKLSR
jgi:hypothetical protein